MFSKLINTAKWAVGYDQPSTPEAKEARDLIAKYEPLVIDAKKTSLPDSKIQSYMSGAIEEIGTFFIALKERPLDIYNSDKKTYTNLQKLQDTLKDELLNQSFYETADVIKNCVGTVAGLAPQFISNGVTKLVTKHPYLTATTMFVPRMVFNATYYLAKLSHKRVERSLQSLKHTIVEKRPSLKTVARLTLDGTIVYLSYDQMKKDPTAPLPYVVALGILLARGYF